jgi:hypothetical protein
MNAIRRLAFTVNLTHGLGFTETVSKTEIIQVKKDPNQKADDHGYFIYPVEKIIDVYREGKILVGVTSVDISASYLDYEVTTLATEDNSSIRIYLAGQTSDFGNATSLNVRVTLRVAYI